MNPPTAGSARAWMDGASRGNPGEAGFGVLLPTDQGSEEIVGYLGKTTNNVAREQNKEADRLDNQAVDVRAPLPPWLELQVPSQ